MANDKRVISLEERRRQRGRGQRVRAAKAAPAGQGATKETAGPVATEETAGPLAGQLIWLYCPTCKIVEYTEMRMTGGRVHNVCGTQVEEAAVELDLRAECTIAEINLERLSILEHLLQSERMRYEEYRKRLALAAGRSIEAYPLSEDTMERLPVESYLQGVLPAEMPPLWPIEALKAQAVAARSEVLASLATKHRLEGFDFCGVEHCRAYAGNGGHSERTDAAVRATRGQILVQGNRIVPAVFASNCGGWTEDNETAWRAPPDAALRGIGDGAGGRRKGAPSEAGVEHWLKSPPESYCSGDEKYFRWTRTY